MGNKNISDLENQLDIIFESLSNILLINQKVPNKENIEQIRYFCEKEVIKNIIILSSYKQKEINLKIIKYISIYISNSSLNDDKNKFNFFKYICEKEYLNQLIIKLNYNLEEKDDDYLSYYINFLKVINNKINADNIKIIFNNKYYIFPLLDQILLLLNNEDIMIRNSARNIFLSLIKLNHLPLIEYLCELPRIAIFIILMRRIKTNILLMINLKNSNKNIFIEKTKEFKEKIIEDLLFMQDILSINISKINYIIINCFFSIVLLFLFTKIISFNDNKNDSNLKSEISKSINVLRIIFKNIKKENIKNILCFLIFSKNIYAKINQYLTNKNIEENKDDKIENTKLLNMVYFNFKYCFSKMKFEDFIICNYSINYFKSIRYTFTLFEYNDKEIFSEIKELYDILKLKDEKNDDQIIIQYLNDKFVNKNNTFIIRMYNFHNFISQKTGINCGIYQNEENNSFLSILYTNFLFLKNPENINDNYFQNNILRIELLNFLEGEINGNNDGNKNIIFNIILFFIEIINDKHINNNLKEILNIIKYTNKNEIKENKLINKDIFSIPNNINSKNVAYPNQLIEPTEEKEFLIINDKNVNFKELNFDNNFFSSINSKHFLSSNINDNSKLINNIIDFIFYPKVELNNNDILLCFRLIENLFNEIYLKNVQLMNYMKSLYLQTLMQIKDILFKNNNDLKNGIFKLAFSYFEKSFYLNKKSISEIINAYYNDIKFSSFVIIENSPNLKEKTNLKKLFQKYICLHDLIVIDSYLFKNIEFPLKLIKKELNFEIGGKVDIDAYKLTKIKVKLSKIINNINTKEENLIMFIFNNFLFFALEPEIVKNFDINAIDGQKLYLIKYMFCLRYINLIKEIDNFTLLFIFDENEYKYNIHVKLEDEINFNEAKNNLVNGINNSIILEFSAISSFINNQINEYYKHFDKK